MKNSKKLTATIRARVPEQDKHNLQKICLRNGLTESQAVRIAVEMYIEHFKK